MKSIFPLIALINICLCTQAQISIRTNWEIDHVKNRPLYISTIKYVIEEKFGEIIESKDSLIELTYNQDGYYLSKKTMKFFNDYFNGNTKSEEKTQTFRYDLIQGKIKKLEFSDDNFSNRTEEVLFEYTDDLITKKQTREFSYEFEYDSNGRNNLYKLYSHNNELIEIWAYSYFQKSLTEQKKYNSDGILLFNKTFEYDKNGNIIKSCVYENKKLKEIISFSYNAKNDLIKEQSINYSIQYESISDQQKKYFYYEYEYFPNGSIKKINKYYHFYNPRDNSSGDMPIDCYEYKYDEHGNWIEKIQWGQINIGTVKKFLPHYKYLRTIKYS